MDMFWVNENRFKNLSFCLFVSGQVCSEFRPKVEKSNYPNVFSYVDDALSSMQGYTDVLAGRSADDMHTAGYKR